MKKDIPGYEGLYAATSDGVIYSHPKEWKSGGAGQIITKHSGKELKQTPNKWGYQMVVLYGPAGIKRQTVHRLIAQTFLDNPSNLAQVNHKDGNKLNNSVSNLEWVTASQNMQHAFDTKLHIPYDRPKGAAEPRAKLTDAEAEEIRNSSDTSRNLGAKYGVHHSLIGRIKKGTRYPKTDQ